MNKTIWTLLLAVTTLWLLIAATPALTRLAGALIPLILVVGITAAALRIVWAVTRRW